MCNIHRTFWILFIIIILFQNCDGGIFSWLFRGFEVKEKKVKSSPLEAPSVAENANPVPKASEEALIANVPFELSVADERFLAEASSLTSFRLSELDKCHHKVILELETSCMDMTEEDLAKISVNLLNCQSAVEKRQIFRCTPAMTIAECTLDMDAHAWNAYHIVSNRAKAVCYSARQQQFQMKTEMTVNNLMLSAQEQINTMKILKDGQEELSHTALETMESLNEGHKHLRKEQSQLSTAHQAIHSYVSSNLRDLAKEKKLIATGQKELVLIAETIKRKLDEARQQLSTQEATQRGAHTKILEDLSEIQDNAIKVWEKLDASTQEILLAHEATVSRYARLTEDLKQMNATVHHLMTLLHTTRQGVEAKLSWITTLVGGTDSQLHKLYSCILHGGYFFVGMISASFLEVPYLTRVALLLLVPLNAVSEVKNGTSLDFTTLTTLLGLCIFVNVLMNTVIHAVKWRGHKHLNITTHMQSLQYQTCNASLSSISSPCCCNRTVSSPQKDAQSNESCFQETGSKVPVQEKDDYSSDEEGEETSTLHPQSPTAASSPSFLLRQRSLFQSARSMENEEVGIEHSVTNLSSLAQTSNKAEMGIEQSDKDMVRRHLFAHLDTSYSTHIPLNTSGHMHCSTPVRDSRSSSRSDTPVRNFSPKKLCAAICKNGQLCRNAASGGSLFCFRHGGNSRESTPAK